MSVHSTPGTTALEQLLRRYEATASECETCGYVDEADNWTGQTNGRQVIYTYDCPSCGASREHTCTLLG